MEFFPIIEIVEVNGILNRAGVVGKTVSAQDRFAGAVIVDVAADSAVQLVDGTFIQFGAILFYPCLELRVSGLAFFDEIGRASCRERV